MFHQKPMLGQLPIPGRSLADGLVFCAPISETSGDKICDLSGNGNDLLITSGAIRHPDGLDLSGAIQIENTNCKNLPTTKGSVVWQAEYDVFDVSVFADFELSDNTLNNRILVYHATGGSGTISCYVKGGGSGADVWLYANAGSLISNGIKYIFAFTWDSIADDYNFYINGVKITPSSSNSAGNPSGIDTINLGSSYSLDWDLDGRLGNFLVYNRILAQSEITQLHRDPYCMFKPYFDPVLMAYIGIYILTADSGSYSLSGTVASLLKNSKISAGAGVYSFSGVAASLLKNSKIVAGSGSYSLSGTPAALLRSLKLSAGAGSYALSGTAAALLKNYKLSAVAGGYILTGTAADLIYSGAPTGIGLQKLLLLGVGK